MVSEPIKGKAPRVDHHNLIPAHLNEELYLGKKPLPKIYGSETDKLKGSCCEILAALVKNHEFFFLIQVTQVLKCFFSMFFVG